MSSHARSSQLRSSRFISLVLVVACLAALGGCAWYLVHRSAALTQANGFGGRRPTATVAFATASLADIPIRMEALGTVTPLATATVRAQVAGVLTKINYTEG